MVGLPREYERAVNTNPQARRGATHVALGDQRSTLEKRVVHVDDQPRLRG